MPTVLIIPTTTVTKAALMISWKMTTVRYFEVKSITHAKNHSQMHHLCMFSKTGSAEYKANHKLMFIKTNLHLLNFYFLGINIQFHLSQVRSDVLVVVELNSIQLPLSLDALPHIISYLDRLYNVMDTIHRCCYENNTSECGYCLGPKIIRAITGQITDRIRSNCFYHPYH